MGLFGIFRGKWTAKSEAPLRPRPTSPMVDKHFALSESIPKLYAKRESGPKALQAAIAACEQQIALAPTVIAAMKQLHTDQAEWSAELRRRFGEKPDKTQPFTLPSHRGYRQLCIIREKQGDYAGAIQLAKQAKKQGWNGDWDKRIERCETKLSKGSGR